MAGVSFIVLSFLTGIIVILLTGFKKKEKISRVGIKLVHADIPMPTLFSVPQG
jgi:hypothetical protein